MAGAARQLLERLGYGTDDIGGGPFAGRRYVVSGQWRRVVEGRQARSMEKVAAVVRERTAVVVSSSSFEAATADRKSAF